MTIENLASKFCYWAEQPLEKLAAAKKKTEKKTEKKSDPKAKTKVSPSAKDKKDKESDKNGKKKKTKKSEFAAQMLALGSRFETKLAQQEASATHNDLTAQLNQALAPYGYSINPGAEAKVFANEKYIDVPVLAGMKAKWKGTTNQSQEVKKILDPITTMLTGFVSKPVIYT